MLQINVGTCLSHRTEYLDIVSKISFFACCQYFVSSSFCYDPMVSFRDSVRSAIGSPNEFHKVLCSPSLMPFRYSSHVLLCLANHNGELVVLSMIFPSY